MIEFSHQGKNKKNLILFVHGLTGNNMTWVNQGGVSFSDLLIENKVFKKKFDIGHFTYYTQFLNLSKVKAVGGIISKLLTGISKITKLNLDVKNISDLLNTELEIKCSKYENIVIIAHSLGGLVSKSAILEQINKSSSPNIKIFFSLAVPHDGATLALLGQLLSKNVQISNLTPLSDLVKDLNIRWIQTPQDLLPLTYYFQGKYDTIVANTSSIGYQTGQHNIQYFPEDHSSISKPTSKDASVYLAIEQVLENFLNNIDLSESLKIKELVDDQLYNDEYFVLKLLVSDVHQKNISTAKRSFYNAEFIRKIVVARNLMSQDEFQNLYALIEGLYDIGFGLLTAGTLKNGNELVAYIHDKIQNEDQSILKSISAINFIHKTGMLHQLANNLKKEVWWTDGHSEETLNSYKPNKS